MGRANLKDAALTDQTLYITLRPLNVSLEGITQTADDSRRTAEVAREVSVFAIKAGEINSTISLRDFFVLTLYQLITCPLGDSTSKLNPKIHKVNVFLIFGAV